MTTACRSIFQQRMRATLLDDEARIPVILGLCGTGRTTLLHRLQADLGRRAVPVRQRRAHGDDARAVSQGPHHLVSLWRVARRDAALLAAGGVRRGARLPLERALRGRPAATFLLDEVLEFRTFESFPGLRRALPELLAVLASTSNRFVLDLALRDAIGARARDRLAAFRRRADAGAVRGRGRRRCWWTRRRQLRRRRVAKPQIGGTALRVQARVADSCRAGAGRPRYAGAHRGRDGRDAGGRPPRPGQRRSRALLGPGGRLVDALRLQLRAAPAPRARLRRAEGDPRDPLRSTNRSRSPRSRSAWGARRARPRTTCPGWRTWTWCRCTGSATASATRCCACGCRLHCRAQEPTAEEIAGEVQGTRSLRRLPEQRLNRGLAISRARATRGSELIEFGRSALLTPVHVSPSCSNAWRAASCSAAFLLAPRAEPMTLACHAHLDVEDLAVVRAALRGDRVFRQRQLARLHRSPAAPTCSRAPRTPGSARPRAAR